MDWRDDGIVLEVKKHGESSAVVNLLTAAHGRHAGLVRGGSGRRARGVLQPGNVVAANWRARLPEHLGTMTCELVKPHAAEVMDDAVRLAALTSACALVQGSMPEREPHPALYEATRVLLEHLAGENWPTLYVRWELGLLGELGFGLDLAECAATGQDHDLAYVSPKSGRAVSLGAGEPYRDKMLALPEFLTTNGRPGNAAEIVAALRLTGHFLEKHVFGHANHGVPEARRRLFERLGREVSTA